MYPLFRPRWQMEVRFSLSHPLNQDDLAWPPARLDHITYLIFRVRPIVFCPRTQRSVYSGYGPPFGHRHRHSPPIELSHYTDIQGETFSKPFDWSSQKLISKWKRGTPDHRVGDIRLVHPRTRLWPLVILHRHTMKINPHHHH